MALNDELARRYSFLDHLEELRWRVIKSLVALVVAVIFSYPFSFSILKFLTFPVSQLIFTAPAEGFGAYFHISLWTGILISSPVWLYQLWAFICSALTVTEKKYIYFFVPLSLLLFLGGIAFGFYVALPVAFSFLLSFSSDSLKAMISVGTYLDFVVNFLLPFGVVFEIPLIVIFLSKIGIASAEFLKQKRGIAILIMTIVSAIVTPPDICSMLLMAIPLMILYEVSILLAKVCYRPHGKKIFIAK